MTTRFRLNAVLDLRRRRVETLEQELAVLERQRAERQAAIAAIHRAMERIQAALREQQASGRLKIREIAQLHGYAGRLESELANEKLLLADLEARCAAKRAELVAAQQERKAIEKLKERAEAQAAHEARTQELRALAEIATVRFNLRRRGSLAGGG
ncbi:MAG: flagellar export protein FliJ [Chloroflexota bacterium]|nr:flagellar export protein FliJ [Dehalococcoidia bacterium]MDW8255329.1 flagellar export protein FliJ [Chloroflexota bacterium]